ncbi:MAG: arylsulfatase [Puniceicoccaceae bacterium]
MNRAHSGSAAGRQICILFIFAFVTTCNAVAGMVSAKGDTVSGPRPNIILIVADDMGYSDAGCFGGEIATPNLDRLGEGGLRLTSFYNAGMCVASRTSLLSGRWHTDAGWGIKDGKTLPEALAESGYRNYAVGKWHLEGHPMERGFDRFYGILNGVTDYYVPNDHFRDGFEALGEVDSGFYATTAFTDAAIGFIRENNDLSGDEPFFLYLAYTAPHNPLQAPREAIRKYRGKYLDGWQAIREARFARQKAMGIMGDAIELPPYPQNLPDWNTLSSAQKDLEDLRMATYAAMIDIMDQDIGRLLACLEKTGDLENTLILFMSDNGSDSFSVLDEEMIARDLLPGDRGSNYQPGRGWAYANNTPMRLYKISQHEGGVCTGAIAWWPAVIQAGQISHDAVHMIDIMPTLVELGARDAKPVETGSGLAGRSLVPLLMDKDWDNDRSLYFQFMDNRGLRTNDWRLAEVDANGWELYYLADDRTQVTDLAHSHPEVLKALAAEWDNWWLQFNNGQAYVPESTIPSPHYEPQGDRGSGVGYVPAAMPLRLKDTFPLPASTAGK